MAQVTTNISDKSKDILTKKAKKQGKTLYAFLKEVLEDKANE